MAKQITDVISYNLADVIFRVLFSLIFLGLGAEHLVDDTLIQYVMPAWMPLKWEVSKLSGLILISGGFLVFAGYKLRLAALVLGVFVLLVSVVVHIPVINTVPTGLPEQWHWMWDVYQRSNLAKNLCLVGVCTTLLHYNVGVYSLEHWLSKRTTHSQ